MNEVVLLTDHSSDEGSQGVLATAVRQLTGKPPVSIDARHFMTGRSGRATIERGHLTLHAPSENLIVRPAVVLIYEIPPVERRRFETFQRHLRKCGAISLGLDAGAWRKATEKNLTVQQFQHARVPQMETISLATPSLEEAVSAFERLGENVWARPTIGAGGNNVFHITNREELHDALLRYAKYDHDWLIARDALNFDQDGRRHQFRIVVLDDQVLRVCEHVQSDPDAPCNEAQGAISTVLPLDGLPDELLRIAVSATRALGLPFGGVDLASEQGGVVFEVNVHPVLDVPGGLEGVAVPFVRAHLALLRDGSVSSPVRARGPRSPGAEYLPVRPLSGRRGRQQRGRSSR